MANLNRVLDKMQGQSKAVSLFHDWSSVDHDFGEIRILLKEAKDKLSSLNLSNPQIDKILSDSKVHGSELKLGKEVKLNDRYVALYLNDDEVLPYNLSTRVKSAVFVNDSPFILPMLLSNYESQRWVMTINDTDCSLIKVRENSTEDIEVDSMPADLTGTLNKYLVSDKLDFNLRDDQLDRKNLELSEGALDENRKRMVKDAVKSILPIVERGHLLILCSNNYSSMVKGVMDSAGQISDYTVENFVPSGANNGEKMKNLLSKVKSIPLPKQNKNNGNTIWVETDSLIDFAPYIKTGQLRSLRINADFLNFCLESMVDIEGLTKFNDWIVENRSVLSDIDSEMGIGAIFKYSVFDGVEIRGVIGDEAALSDDILINTAITEMWKLFHRDGRL